MLYWCNFPHPYSKKYLIVFKSILSLKKKNHMKGRVPTLGTPPPPLDPPMNFAITDVAHVSDITPSTLFWMCVSQRHLVAMIKGVNRCHKLGRFLCLFIFQQRTTYQEGIFDFHYELEVILVIIFLITLKFFGNVQITIENNYN